MKIYRKILTVCVATALCVLNSCTDFVDLNPPTIVRQDQYFASQGDFQAAVNGMYASLRTIYNNFYAVAEIPSDNTQANGYNIAISPLDQMTWLENNTNIQSLWLNSYSTISQSNVILDKIDGVAMDDPVKERFKAEAKFIRALMYFNLVQFFGEVPLVIKEIQTEEEAYTYLREPVDQVYGQIEADLLDAVASLPTVEEVGNGGRAVKQAASGLLAKVYVTQKQFGKAVPILNELAESGWYGLLGDYESVFSVDNKHNQEIVFAVQYLGNGNGEGSSFSIRFAPFGSGTEITSGGNPAQGNEGTQDLWDAYEEGDLRRPVAIERYPATGVYYTRKFLDRPISSNEGNNNWPILRFADVLLLQAEALNETGASSDALVPLNMVRRRAGLEAISNTDQVFLSQAIQQERRVELSFEGHRWFDLLRTGTMEEVMTAYKNRGVGYQVEFYEVTENKALFPIPFRERNLNPNLTQNNGYN